MKQSRVVVGILSQLLLEFPSQAWVSDMLIYSSSMYKATAESYTQTHFPWDKHLFSETVHSRRKRNIYSYIIASIIYKAVTSTMKSNLHIIVQNTVNSFPFFFCLSHFGALRLAKNKKGDTSWSQIAIPFATQRIECSFGRLFVIPGLFLANGHLQHIFRGRKMFIILAKTKQ